MDGLGVLVLLKFSHQTLVDVRISKKRCENRTPRFLPILGRVSKNLSKDMIETRDKDKIPGNSDRIISARLPLSIHVFFRTFFWQTELGEVGNGRIERDSLFLLEEHVVLKESDEYKPEN